MAPTTIGQRVPHPSERADQPAAAVAQLQQRLLGTIDRDASFETSIARCLRVLRETIRPAAIAYYRRGPNQPEVVPDPKLSPPGTGNVQGDFQQRLDQCCRAAAASGSVRSKKLTGSLAVVGVPVLLRVRPAEVIGIVTSTASGLETAIALSQVVATHIVLAEAVVQIGQAEIESTQFAALIELLTKCQSASNLGNASVVLVNELKAFLRCHTVAIGSTGFRQHDCRLTAVSGMAKFDPHGEFSTAIEAALDEAIVRSAVTVLPASSETDRTATLAHQRAMAIAAANTVVSSPLNDDQGNTIGAWIFFGDDGVPQQLDRTRAFVKSARDQVGSTLNLIYKATESPLKRQLRLVSNAICRARIKAMLLAAAVCLGLMLLPLPYRIGCSCQVQPVLRRFVAAPYDGKLERTFVEPGDEVKVGDLLARLDGRELRWELAGLEAEYNRAAKTRDAAMAVDSIGEAQQATLEKERLALKLELTRNRLKNLEVRSPLEGIVVSGDLRKAEGAPLAIGQTLFEIAPLDRMILEVEIPEREVLYVEAGQPVTFRADANPLKRWSGRIKTVFPRPEIRESQSVYVAEVDVENRSAELRPGMKGHAKVISSRHALGWNLFHRAYESLCMFVGW